MENNLSYLTPEGHTVFTAQYLKNRGTCCKSACLHCPYGYTLKKHRLEFQDVLESDISVIKALVEECLPDEVDWQAFFPENLKIIKLKDVTCGLLLKNHIVIKHLLLRPQFKNQDLSKELVESYLFI